jgi:PadR family transcriptional regulator PadR
VAAESLDLLRGTFDLLILRSVSGGPAHGYTIAQWIERSTDDLLQIEEGTLYTALHRLEGRGFVKAEWGVSDNNRRARFYSLTAPGRRTLRAETSKWSRLVRVLVTAIETPSLSRAGA